MSGLPNRYVYGATKAAVIGLTKAVAADFIKQGIRVQRHLPRHDRVAVARRAHRDAGEEHRPAEKAVRQAFIDRQPMGRLGKPEEIAALAVYLASDESSYTTGQIHLVDGGFAL